MKRYIGENKTRNKKTIIYINFILVFGHFIGIFKSQIERISRNKGINGTALAITNLLLCVEVYKVGRFTHEK